VSSVLRIDRIKLPLPLVGVSLNMLMLRLYSFVKTLLLLLRSTQTMLKVRDNGLQVCFPFDTESGSDSSEKRFLPPGISCLRT
jgi:hypothetical protein